MFRTSFSQRVIVVGLLTALLAGGSALADRDDRGGRGGGDRGRSGSGDGGGRSFSRGGGGGESRSFSRGSGGESRSFSGGGGESRSFSRGDFGGSSRSSSQSFNSRPSRSFSESAPSSRSFEGSRSFSRPSEGSSPRSRTFSVQPRESFDSGQTSRSYQRVPSSNNADRPTVQRNFDRGSSDSPQFSGQFQQGNSNRSSGEFDRSRGDSGNAQSPNRREYVAGRPTNDDVRNFLQTRQDGTSNQSGSQSGRTNVGDRRFDGDVSRGPGDRRANDVLTDNARQQNLRNRATESRNEGDRSWSQRFGDGNTSNVNRGDNVRDLANRNLRNRDFGDRNFVDQKYESWKKGAWRGDGDKRGDHRDWSGRWKEGDRFVAADRIRKDWDRDWDHDNFPFRSGWNNSHWHGGHNHWNNWGYWDRWSHSHRRPWYWWGWATAPLLTSWVNYGWNTPYYWDYGPGEYIYCYDDVIYVNGRWFQPAPVYYDNAVVIAESAPDWTPEQAQQVEWLPLGVFAIARDGVPDQNLLVQLAVTKDGVIGGTATNKLTGAGFPIEGKVDKETQRAVWTYTDDKNARIVMETSVYNLTQPEATGLVHYGQDDIQVVELVRLEGPEGGSAPAATTPAPAELPAP